MILTNSNLTVLPGITFQYKIRINGKVEMGEQVSNFLKTIYSEFSGNTYTNLELSDIEHKLSKDVLEAPFIHEIMSKDQMTHIYGTHDEENEIHEKYNNIKV